MHYGDGLPGNLEWPTSASLDTVAHEIGHGVTQFTSNLDYTDGSETAGLNESMSDVFAALVTHRVRNDDAKDFTFAEDDNNAGVPIRSMIQPELSSLRQSGGSTDVGSLPRRATTYDQANIPNHAFYLLVHGDTHARSRIKVPCGIGWAAADRLYWRLQTQYVQQTETFQDFALHSLAAARELSINERPIACAWVAVGVLGRNQVMSDWNVTCETDEAGAPDASDNVLVERTPELVECSQSLTGPGASLTN
jgi:thermolysin